MKVPDLQKRNDYWIKIALSDLESSCVLYEAGHYRTSYFLFQQASEKANKAFALFANFATEQELRKVGHDQFKMYRSELVKNENEIKQLIDTIQTWPRVAGEYEIMGLDSITSIRASQLELISIIDGLQHRDLVHLSTADLIQMYKLLQALSSSKFRMPRNPPAEVKEAILKVADWTGRLEAPAAQHAKKELKTIANDSSKSKAIYSIMKKTMNVTLNFSFVFFTLCTCALLTIKHSSLARYPENGKDPMRIYTSKLPIIIKQPLFAALLRESLIRLQKMNRIA